MSDKGIDVDKYESKITVRDMTGKTHKKKLRPRRHINYSAMGDRKTMLVDVVTEIIVNDLALLNRKGGTTEETTEIRSNLIGVNEIFDQYGHLLDTTRTMKNNISRAMLKDAREARKEEKRERAAKCSIGKRITMEFVEEESDDGSIIKKVNRKKKQG